MRQQAENIFEPRNLGQADRAIEAIDAHLAPITDIAQRGGQHIQNARTASNLLYAAANARAAPVDPEVAALLQTEAGQDALARAQRIASNEGRDPNAMGFDLDDQGNVVLRDVPSFETLDLVKRGFDSRLAEARNPMTGHLDLTGNPELGAIEGLRQRFVGRLDEINPEYPKARAAYAEHAQRKDALDRGYKAPTSALRPRDLNHVVGGLEPEGQLPEFQRGYATNLADQTEAMRRVSNPFTAITGAPAQQQKLGMVFPRGASDFQRIADLERAMSKTHTELLGGSQTAGRLQADAELGGGLATTAVDLATGGGLGSLWQAGRRIVGDTARLGIGSAGVRRAESVADPLFTTQPVDVGAFLDDLIARQAVRAARQGKAGRVGSGFGAGILLPAVTGQ